ncbi:class I SAM-dependent methyltransferase [Streptomyces kronopolitis]|uniref:class I SAM-dependent methyltransferase n=1 Tax=Streptomyces kronopolitis TaxID=1612435 RepID=UPI0034128880
MPRPEELPNPYWNHNVHYHRLVLGAVPEGCARALDIGCGDGLLARKLARRIPEVTGVDRSPAMIRLAGEAGARSPNATFVEADFLAADESLCPDVGQAAFLKATQKQRSTCLASNPFRSRARISTSSSCVLAPSLSGSGTNPSAPNISCLHPT